MQRVNRNPVLSWGGPLARRLIHEYDQLLIVFGKLRAVINEYWLPGERNRDRLLLASRERALSDGRDRNPDDDMTQA